MDQNNSSSSSSSICSKIRQALSNNTALKAVQRITSFNQEQQEPKPVTKNPNSPTSNITTISIQSKPHPHHNKQGSDSGAVPIKFDHTTPKLSDHNGKKSSVITSVAKGAPSERATNVSDKGESHPHVSMQGKQNGQVLHYSHPQGNKKQTDINEHFKVFIDNTREKMMRSVTNIGWGQSNQHHHEDAEDHHHETHGSNKNESHFSEFIQGVRKKLRTTTIRKSGSLREK